MGNYSNTGGEVQHVTTPRKKILFLTARFPFPVIGGDRLKSFHLLRHLGKHHDVTLVSFHHGTAPSHEKIQSVERLGVEVIPIEINALKGVRNSLRHLFSNQPLEISFYNQREFQGVIDRLVGERRFDLAISFFMRTAEYIKDLSIPKILIAEDCRTLYQTRSSEASGSWSIQRFVRKWEVMKLKRYEPKIVRHFDTVTLVSPEDITAMRAQNNSVRYRLLTNGTEIQSADFSAQQSHRRDVLLAGRMDIWANVLMAKAAVNEIMPRIHKTIPNVHLNIVGAFPHPQIFGLADSTTHIHANVTEMKDYLARAAIFLHPHMGGSGIQNKVLEAMSMGCPVVTSETGLQGIDAVHEVHALICKNWEDFASNTIRLLQDPHLRSSLASNARELVERTHSWGNVHDALDSIIEEVCSQHTSLQIATVKST